MTPRMIVVTGGAGFIGSNIVARLTAEWEAKVAGLTESGARAKDEHETQMARL